MGTLSFFLSQPYINTKQKGWRDTIINPAIIYLCTALSIFITNMVFFSDSALCDGLGSVIIYILTMPYTIIYTKVFYHYIAHGITITSPYIRFFIHATFAFLAMALFNLIPVFLYTSSHDNICFRTFTNPYQSSLPYCLYGYITYMGVAYFVFYTFNSVRRAWLIHKKVIEP